MKLTTRGFTLIELMMTVAVVAILAAVAYPSYRNQLLRSHRVEAKSALLQMQVAQEKYFLQNNAYGSLTALGLSAGTSYDTPNGYYRITVTLPATPPNTTYTAQATALGGQTSDTACATFTIDNMGATTPSPSTGCWK